MNWRRAQKEAKPPAVAIKARPFPLFCKQWLIEHPGVQGRGSLAPAAAAWRALSAEQQDGWKVKARAVVAGELGPVAGGAQEDDVPAIGGQTPTSPAMPGPATSAPAAGSRGSLAGQTAAGGQAPDLQALGGQASGVEATPASELVMSFHCGPYTAHTSTSSKLGSGTYGTVFRGHHTESGAPVAVKLFHLQGGMQVTQREVEVYELIKACGLKHPPFAHCFASSAAPFQVIVLEEFEHDLRAVPPTTHQALKLVAVQVLRGLAWLHQEYVHCDLKPANILWTTVGQRVALADFGCCEKPNEWLDSPNCCTPNYRGPELWPRTCSGVKIRPSIDIWSFACSLWEMHMEGRLFFPDGDSKTLRVTVEAFAIQHRCRKFDSWHKRIHRAGAWGPIIEQCMKPIAMQRPTAQQVLERVHGLSG